MEGPVEMESAMGICYMKSTGGRSVMNGNSAVGLNDMETTKGICHIKSAMGRHLMKSSSTVGDRTTAHNNDEKT